MFSKRQEQFNISDTINRMADLQYENRLLQRDVVAYEQERDKAVQKARDAEEHERMMEWAHKRELVTARIEEHLSLWSEGFRRDPSDYEIEIPRQMAIDLNSGDPRVLIDAQTIYEKRQEWGLIGTYHSNYGIFTVKPVEGNKIRVVVKQCEEEKRSE